MGARPVKRVLKSRPGPQSLSAYKQNHPGDTWGRMRDNNAERGSQAARECRAQAVRDQRGLCAYCEQEIAADNPLHCQVEHFHPKSDRAGTRNWGLDWENMLAVCDGGSRGSPEERKTRPLPESLYCDAHKDREIQIRKLPKACEGHLLNPLEIPAFPNLFALDKGTGFLRPDATSCAAVKIPGNAFGTTAELVKRTIAALNLNCDRLAEKRRLLVVDIDKTKQTLRQKGTSAAVMRRELIRRYFSTRWPAFFTTLRCCLGQAAENHLRSISYQG